MKPLPSYPLIKMRLLFISDIHGSQYVFDKIISTLLSRSFDGLIIAGDLSGKSLYPIIHSKNNYSLKYEGNFLYLDETQIKEYEDKISGYGQYYFYTTSDQVTGLMQDQGDLEGILNEKICERLESWINRIIEQLDLNELSVIVSPGNDDPLLIDEVLGKYSHVGLGNSFREIVYLKDYELVTMEFTNPTPWKTFRELEERDLQALIDDRVRMIHDPRRTIFNFHCPPYNTKLDLVPEISNDMRYLVTPGGQRYIHAGSKAVRHAIEKYQPMLSLHGHMHESSGFDYIGKTLCLNPGSEYMSGIMRAYIIEIDSHGQVVNFCLIDS